MLLEYPLEMEDGHAAMPPIQPLQFDLNEKRDLLSSVIATPKEQTNTHPPWTNTTITNKQTLNFCVRTKSLFRKHCTVSI
mmetsp:Transcript_1769/g.3149  ORF Transcript_1769/g.3149 Transcript_1769/m.3149 type:complete len:80 (+) Transcript_1769:1926-2165(+)